MPGRNALATCDAHLATSVSAEAAVVGLLRLLVSFRLHLAMHSFVNMVVERFGALYVRPCARLSGVLQWESVYEIKEIARLQA